MKTTELTQRSFGIQQEKKKNRNRRIDIDVTHEIGGREITHRS